MAYVLVACEESQRVCTAFREKSHTAFSCDILPCSGGHPEWHIRCDVREILKPNFGCWIVFETDDGKLHSITDRWDLIIAHPPCTRLCSSGQRWRHFGSPEYRANKENDTIAAIEFFMMFTAVDCDHIAIENPVGIMSSIWRKPDCIYNPYDFEGETDCKKTCLWLWGLPPLKPTQTLPKEQRTQNMWRAHFNGKAYAWNSPETARLRSQTPWGVARAMADQWSPYLDESSSDDIIKI